MKRIVLLLTLLYAFTPGKAQKLSGQWTGGFNSGSNDIFGKTEYVLELEVKGSEVKGFSYTYFSGYEKRYYVICRLTGSYDKSSKSVVVKEVEKVKSNTPPDFQDCMQIHSLTYMKGSDSREVLVGKWKPARPQDNCGTGQTELERKALVRVIPKNTDPAIASAKTNSKPKTDNTTAKKTPPQTTTKAAPPTAKTSTGSKSTSKSSSPPVTKSTAKTNNSTAKTTAPPVIENKNKPQTIEKTLPNIEKPKAPSTIDQSLNKLYLRSKQVIRTVEVDANSFRVDLYDNGQIDGDTISVFYNGKLMVSKQRLSTDPISMNITIDPSRNDNELVMYAENLGTIPPNTALMVVTVGGKRYEVNISSSEQTSGTVKFKLRPTQ